VPSRRTVPVSKIESVDHIHAADHFPEWSEPLAVESRVVAVVDEYLRRTRARPGCRECYFPFSVALFHRIVGYTSGRPQRRAFRVAVHSKLNHKLAQHP